MERMKRIIVNGGALNCDDILHEILLRIPPPSIFELITVSKIWMRVICSPSFRRDYLRQWGQSFRLLGFFVCNLFYLGRPRGGYRRPRWEPALPFLSTCSDGDDLKHSGILKHLGYFMDCSKGIILSGLLPKTFYVYHTETKQKYQLPEPQQFYKVLCMAFIVEEYLDGDTCYKVIRARCESKLKERNTVSIETYSSKTGKWKQSTLMCSTLFALRPKTAAMVVGGVVHWFAIWGKLAIYDPRLGDRYIALIKLPTGVLTRDHEECVLGESSDGLLQYGQGNDIGVEIWMLEKEPEANNSSIYCNCTRLKYNWVLRWRLNFKVLWKQMPSLSPHSKEIQLLSFLPQNSTSIFIRSGWSILLYDLKTKMMEIVKYEGRGGSISWESSRIVPYFLPSWPHSSCAS